MNMEIHSVLKGIRLAIEDLWRVWVLLWNLPIAIIELIWLRIFDKERYQVNIKALKDMWKNGGNR